MSTAALHFEQLFNNLYELDSLILFSRAKYPYQDTMPLIGHAFICQFEGIYVSIDACAVTGRYSYFDQGLEEFKSSHHLSDRLDIVISTIALTIRRLIHELGIEQVLISLKPILQYVGYSLRENEIFFLDTPDGSQVYVYLKPTVHSPM